MNEHGPIAGLARVFEVKTAELEQQFGPATREDIQRGTRDGQRPFDVVAVGLCVVIERHQQHDHPCRPRTRRSHGFRMTTHPSRTRSCQGVVLPRLGSRPRDPSPGSSEVTGIQR